MTPTRTDTTRTATPADTPARRPRINPRIRERRIEVQREAGRRRLRVLLVISSVVSAAGLAFLLVTSPLLDVDRISVVGARHVTPAEVRAAAGVPLHRHLLFVDTGAIARRVEQMPWVARASVQRDLPGTLRIVIREYTPTAFVRAGSGVMLVAANGRVFARATTSPPGAVEIRGVRRPPAVGDQLSPPDAASVVAHLPPALAHSVAAVDVTTGLTLDMNGGGEIRLGDSTRLADKAASALAVIAQLNGTTYSYIDVSLPQRPVSHP